MVQAMKKVENRAGGGARRCFVISLVIITVIMLMPSSGKNQLDDNLRSGQAQQHSTTTADLSTDSYASENDGEIRDTINTAMEEIKDAEEEELAKTKTALSAAIETAGDYVRIGLQKLLGSASGVTEADIDDMVIQVENRLTEDVNNELQEKADGFVSEEETKIDETAEEDEENGESLSKVEDDVLEQEGASIVHVRQEIDDTAAEMRKRVREKAQEVEKQILEDRLSKKLGKRVKLMIIDDEISGIDELLDDLNVLKGGEPSNPSSSSFSSGGGNSYSTAGGNSYGSSGYSSGSYSSGGTKYGTDDLGD